MSFQNTSRKITISSSFLSAECCDWNKNFQQSFIDLNKYIGNSDGTFTLTEAGFAQTASSLSLRGAVLFASLKTRSGSLNNVSFDLNLCIANMNGKLEFQKPYV